MSLTSEDGQAYAQQQRQRQGDDPGRLGRAGEDVGAAPRAPSATDPMSVKLADVATRNAILFNPDDLSVVNASVVELQAYEALLAAPPQGLPVIIDVPYVTQDGAVLNCTMGNWENEPSSYVYQWQLDGADVGVPVDTSTYTVIAEDVGRTATCVVTATNSAGSVVAPVSNSVVVADPGPALDTTQREPATGWQDSPAREA
jgi:hypothetical protein